LSLGFVTLIGSRPVYDAGLHPERCRSDLALVRRLRVLLSQNRCPLLRKYAPDRS
jgi:hypothetical protein